MSHFILSEPDEHRLWRVQRVLFLVADLAASAPTHSLNLNGEDLAVLCRVLAEHLPTGQTLPFHSGEPS